MVAHAAVHALFCYGGRQGAPRITTIFPWTAPYVFGMTAFYTRRAAELSVAHSCGLKNETDQYGLWRLFHPKNSERGHQRRWDDYDP